MSCWNGAAKISSAPSNRNICLLLLGRLAVGGLLRNPWLLLWTTVGAGGAPILEQAIAGESECLLPATCPVTALCWALVPCLWCIPYSFSEIPAVQDVAALFLFTDPMTLRLC